SATSPYLERLRRMHSLSGHGVIQEAHVDVGDLALLAAKHADAFSAATVVGVALDRHQLAVRHPFDEPGVAGALARADEKHEAAAHQARRRGRLGRHDPPQATEPGLPPVLHDAGRPWCWIAAPRRARSFFEAPVDEGGAPGERTRARIEARSAQKGIDLLAAIGAGGIFHDPDVSRRNIQRLGDEGIETRRLSRSGQYR